MAARRGYDPGAETIDVDQAITKHPTEDEIDAALEETFPASDPPAWRRDKQYPGESSRDSKSDQPQTQNEPCT